MKRSTARVEGTDGGGSARLNVLLKEVGLRPYVL